METTHRNKGSGAKAGASVEPVGISQLVNLDAFLVCRLMRHGLCHHQRFVAPRGDVSVEVEDEVGRNVDVLLERQFRLRLREQSENRHGSEFVARSRDARGRERRRDGHSQYAVTSKKPDLRRSRCHQAAGREGARRPGLAQVALSVPGRSRVVCRWRQR